MEFWQGKKVLITGHTGFKGSWLSLWLQSLGAELIGFSLAPPTQPNLFEITQLRKGMVSLLGDVCDFQALKRTLKKYKPEIIIHMAAQSLVRYSYLAPLKTYTTNVMGTVNLLEAVRFTDSVKVLINVTSDKCYENKELSRGYREKDSLGGYDPYSNSKACSELVTQAYSRSYLKNMGINMATVRAGNVIGGGDWAEDRLVPDILRAVEKKKSILMVRNPLATRPWQHVIEPLSGYLLLAKKLWEGGNEFASAWNFGPSADDVRPVKWIVEELLSHYEGALNWQVATTVQAYEAHTLSLDSTKAHKFLDWKIKWNIEQTLLEIASWHKAWMQGKDMREASLQQINSYCSTFNSDFLGVKVCVT